MIMNMGLMIFICCEVIGVIIIHNLGWKDKPSISRAQKWKFTIVLSVGLLLWTMFVSYVLS